jgi:polyisoprenyl-phosphate glycosyltransferase
MSKPKCTLVIALLNEEPNIAILYERIVKAINDRQNIEWEFLFLDDGSTDNTFSILKTFNMRDPRVKCLRLSRNFGAHEATAAGLQFVSGAAAVVMAGDLQDPPELLIPFVDAWQKGYHVVWGVRESREDSMWVKIISQCFYSVFCRLSGTKRAKKGSGSFFLISPQVVDAYNLIREHNRVTFEIIHWLGFKQTEVGYTRTARNAGVSKFGFRLRLKTAVDSLFSVTHLPIRLITYAGMFFFVSSIAYAAYIIYCKLIGTIISIGWSSLMVANLLLNGVVLISVGIIGEYSWRILDEARNRPLYIVMEILGDVQKPKNRSI